MAMSVGSDPLPPAPPPPSTAVLPSAPPMPPVLRSGARRHVLGSALGFGVLGASVGLGLSFLPLPLPLIGAAPIAAAIGGAAGVLFGVWSAVRDNRREGLPSFGGPPPGAAPPPPPPNGAVAGYLPPLPG